MSDTKIGTKLKEMLPPDYPVRVAFGLRKNSGFLITPQFVRKVVEADEISKDVWTELDRISVESETAGGNDKLLPKKYVRHIQEVLKARNVNVDDRYVRMIIKGERENREVLKAVFDVIENYQSELKESRKSAINLMRRS